MYIVSGVVRKPYVIGVLLLITTYNLELSSGTVANTIEK